MPQPDGYPCGGRFLRHYDRLSGPLGAGRQWFTARVTGRHKALPAWYGEVVDPGTFTLWRDGVVRPWAIGEVAPNLRDQFLTVMEESGPGAQP
jgi:hypothetical protein